jgi:hypothetical protein
VQDSGTAQKEPLSLITQLPALALFAVIGLSALSQHRGHTFNGMISAAAPGTYALQLLIALLAMLVDVFLQRTGAQHEHISAVSYGSNINGVGDHAHNSPG